MKLKRKAITSVLGLASIVGAGCQETYKVTYDNMGNATTQPVTPDYGQALGFGLMTLGYGRGHAPSVDVGRAAIDYSAAQQSKTEVNVNVPNAQQGMPQYSGWGTVYDGFTYSTFLDKNGNGFGEKDECFIRDIFSPNEDINFSALTRSSGTGVERLDFVLRDTEGKAVETNSLNISYDRAPVTLTVRKGSLRFGKYAGTWYINGKEYWNSMIEVK